MANFTSTISVVNQLLFTGGELKQVQQQFCRIRIQDKYKKSQYIVQNYSKFSCFKLFLYKDNFVMIPTNFLTSRLSAS